MTLIKFRSNSRRIRSAAIKDQRLWSENVRKVGPLTQWIILFGIFPHKLCSVSGRRPNPHLVSLCFQPWRRRYQTDVGPISKAPIYLHASGQRASIAVFFFAFLLVVVVFVFCFLLLDEQSPCSDGKAGNRTNVKFPLAVQSHSAHCRSQQTYSGPRQVWFYMKSPPLSSPLPKSAASASQPALACQLINWIPPSKRSRNTAGYEESRCLLLTIWNDNLSHGKKESKIRLCRCQQYSVTSPARGEHFISY